MCVSADVSFTLGTILFVGGSMAVHRTLKTDRRYSALAVFPALVGIQQVAEGFVWLAADSGSDASLRGPALAYLFFTWMVWPSWVPYMVARLEPNSNKKRALYGMALGGLLLGAFLYLPNFWMRDWLSISTLHHSIVYECTFLSADYVPLAIPYLVYLTMIGLPSLLSTHSALKIFGMILIMFVFMTYFFFSYAHVSVLCFFAAAITGYILHIIFFNRCSQPGPLQAVAVS